jgi:hypothetical protein
MSRRMPILGLVTCAALAGTLAWLWRAPSEPASMPPPIAETGTPDNAGLLAAPFTLPRPRDFAHISERPLFLASRRLPELPEPAAKAAKAPPPLAAPGFVLSGVVRDGGQHVSIISLKKGQPATVIRVGDKLGGWEVEEISRSAVHLSAGKRELEVQLRPDEVAKNAVRGKRPR